MADIPFSQLSGGSSLPKLAPDLTYPSSLGNDNGFVTVTNIDGTAGAATALSLTGKFSIDLLQFTNLTSEAITVNLTVDGEIVWNDSFTVGGTTLKLLGTRENVSGNGSYSSIQCDSSLLLEIETTTDTSVTFYYLARPIL